jgi:murein DD-endopeptidase MepM/ murein hydrolase activator NlpD
VINDGWPTLTPGRKLLLILALIGLGYLLWPSRQNQATISGWSAKPFAVASANGLQPLQPQGASEIKAAAQPIGQGLPADGDTPAGNPLGKPNTVMTQGYGVGSHAPANIWGAVDLAIDGNGDGSADPQGTLGTPVYATHDGVVHLAANTWPAGNHIWVEGAHFKTGYSHLKGFAVQDGQQVRRGDVIGYAGSTGESSGPHLDYQVWKDGVNVNPLDYGAIARP